MKLQVDSLTWRQARALIRYDVRDRLARYRGQSIWNTSFFVDRVDLAEAAYGCQVATKPDGQAVGIDELIAVVREEFADFLSLEDTKGSTGLQSGRQTIACEACCKPYEYDPVLCTQCPTCGRPSLFQVTELELDALDDLVQGGADDPIIVHVLARTKRWQLESAYGKLVTRFETFHKKLNEIAYAKAGQPTVKPKRLNYFQNPQDTWIWFRDHHGLALDSSLRPGESLTLECVFSARHVLVHNGGLVDEKYLERVTSSQLNVGEAIPLREPEILEAIGLVRRVVHTARAALS